MDNGNGEWRFACFVICPMMKQFVESQLKRNRFAAEHAEFAVDNFIGFVDECGFAVSAEDL